MPSRWERTLAALLGGTIGGAITALAYIAMGGCP